MYDLVPILVPIACGCVLPIMIVWLDVRKKMAESQNRTQIILAAIEKNPDMDIEELMNKISPKKKLLKEKLLSKLQTGNITAFLGIPEEPELCVAPAVPMALHDLHYNISFQQCTTQRRIYCGLRGRDAEKVRT